MASESRYNTFVQTRSPGVESVAQNSSYRISGSCDIGSAAVNEALTLSEMQAIFVLSRPKSLQS